jgi:hypothetical protein
MKKYGLIPALIGVMSITAVSCVFSVDPAPVSVGTSYYNPMYYNGYVVYYDTLGRPIYYVNGATYYVPSTYVHYHALSRHYVTYRHHYHRWYGSHGHRYRTYHRSHHRSHGRTYHRRRR